MTDQETPDNELMTRCREGSTDAFETLVDRHKDRLVNFFYGLCNNRARAEDFAQEVFIKIFKNRDSYEPSGKFTSYMFTIAKNHWYDYLRSKESDRNPISLDQPLGSEESDFNLKSLLEHENALEPHQALTEEEKKELLHRAVEQLPESHRMVIVLSNFEQKPHEEISEILDIPVGTVKSRKYLAIDKLESILQEMESTPDSIEDTEQSAG